MAYTSIADADKKKWEGDFASKLKSGRNTTKTLPNGMKITVNDGQFDLAAFHKAYDDWFDSHGLLGLFDDDGQLKARQTYGEIKKLDKKEPAAKGLYTLWGAQFSLERKIDDSGMPTVVAKQQAAQQAQQAQKAQQAAQQAAREAALQKAWDGLREILEEICDSDEAKDMAKELKVDEKPVYVYPAKGYSAFCDAQYWSNSDVPPIKYTFQLKWHSIDFQATGMRFSVICPGESYLGKEIDFYRTVDLADEAATNAELLKWRKDLVDDAKKTIEKAIGKRKTISQILDVFKGNREELARICDIDAIEKLGKLRWIAVDTQSGMKTLCRVKLGSDKLKNAYAIFDYPTYKPLGEPLQGAKKVIAAQFDCDGSSNGRGYTAWSYTDYYSSSASQSDLKKLDVETQARAGGIPFKNIATATGSWGNGAFDGKSVVHAELDSSD